MSSARKPVESEDPRVRRALEEYFARLDRGEAVDAEAFLKSHPEIAGELRSFIVTAGELEQMAGNVRSPEPAAASETSTHSVASRGDETLVPQRVEESAARGGLLPEKFGRYRIVRPLGKGAMGMVFLAEDTQLQRQVALKTPSFEEDETGELLERFYREARAAANLQNANICQVYDVGAIDGRHYISMAYIQGRPLSAYIQPNKLQSEKNVLTVIRKLALALQEAHDAGIVHRDLKPANVMINTKGEPVIMDFGLARKVQGDDEVRLTQSGMIVGSPAYMSPEQVEGNPAKIGPATDQYALGVMLYELLTGQLPFRGSMTAVIGQILTKDAQPPGELRADLHPRVEALCRRMMAKSPADRLPSMKAVAAEIAAILPELKSKSPSAKRDPSAAGAAASVLTAASVVGEGTSEDSMTASNLAALTAAAKKCLAHHDYDQAIRMLEQVSDAKRTDEIRALLEKARGLSDEVAFLLSEIEEAVRKRDAEAALRSAGELQRLKPGHHRVKEVERDFGSYGTGGKVRGRGGRGFGWRIGEGTGFFWPAVAVGGLAFVLMLGAVVFYLRAGDAVVRVTINDPDVKVGLQGRTLTLESARDAVKVRPGEEKLTINYGDLEFETPKFTLRKGENPAVVVELLDGTLTAKFGDEVLATRDVESGRLEPPAASAANYALQFDGNLQRVEVNSLSWDGTAPLTIEAWVQTSFTKPFPMAVAYLKGTSAWELRSGGKRWISDIEGIAGPTNLYETPESNLADQPIHLAAVLDDTTHRLFENGKLIAEKRHSRDWRMDHRTGGLSLGQMAYEKDGKWIYQFLGWIDEVRISKAARYTADFTPERRFEPDDKTLALYHCDEGTGEVLSDSSGNGHHGKLVGAKWTRLADSGAGAALPEMAGANHALQFDGRTSYVHVPSLTWDGTPSLTMEAWVDNPLDRNRAFGMMLFRLQGKEAIQLLFSSRNRTPAHRWIGQVYNSSTRPSVGVNSDELPQEADRPWHVALVLDKGEMRLFENGRLIDSKPHSGTWNGEYTRTGLTIGALLAEDETWKMHFEGTMDEIRVSKTARYQDDFAPDRRFEPDAQTLALYHCDEGDGDVLIDASGNGHHGKVTAAAWSKSPLGDSPPAGTSEESTSAAVAGAAVLLPPGEWVPLLADEEQFRQWTLPPNMEQNVSFAGGELTLVGPNDERQVTLRRSLRRSETADAIEFIVHLEQIKNGFSAGPSFNLGSSSYGDILFRGHELWVTPSGGSAKRVAGKILSKNAGVAWWSSYDYVVLDGEFTAYANGKPLYSCKAENLQLPILNLHATRATARWRNIAIMRLTSEQANAIRSGQLPKFTPGTGSTRVDRVEGSGAIDLIGAVDLAQAGNSYTTWTRQGTKLVRTGQGPQKGVWSGLNFPTEIRGDYDLELDVVVRNVQPFQLGVPVGDKKIVIDFGPGGSGLQAVDEKGWFEHPQRKHNKGAKLQHGPVQHITISVRHDEPNVSVDVELDGKHVDSYSGPLSRLGVPSWQKPTPYVFQLNGLGDAASIHYEVHRCVVRPAGPGTGGKWVDLLEKTIPDPVNSRGVWTRTSEGGLAGNKEGNWPFPELNFYRRPRASYDLEAGVKFVEADHVIFYLPAGRGMASLVLIRSRGGFAGWETSGSFAPGTIPGSRKVDFDFQPGTEYVVRVKVEVEGSKVRFSGTVNDRPLPVLEADESQIAASGPPKGLNVTPVAGLLENLGVHVGAGSTATLTRFRYRTLEGDVIP